MVPRALLHKEQKMNLIEHVREALQKALQDAWSETVPVEVTPATAEKFGHYQCNSAMKLTKALGKPPREVASGIVEKLDQSNFSKVEIAGPGFINLTLSADLLEKGLMQMFQGDRLGIAAPLKKERVIVEFSSPNIAKEMHVGHLRSTIIGESIARLFEFLGYDVLRLNHVGDWGTAFGMLIAYIKQEIPALFQGEMEADLQTLMQWYRASKKLFDEDASFRETSRLEVVELQSGDPESMKAWDQICEISRRGYQEVYDLLDVQIIERGESSYNAMLPLVVADLEEKGLVTVSEGAKCIFHEGLKIPLMVQKSDGGYNYDTTDMAAMLHRAEDEEADRIIVITDAGQSLHFQLVEKTAIQAGYLDPEKHRFDHVTFGVVLGPDGKKFKTRSGETVRLIDLLHEAVRRASKVIEERNPDMSADEKKNLAEVLGIDAVKYADLSSNRSSDYVFSFDRMLRFEGNTAAFILYSYVRVRGIQRKVGERDLENASIHLVHPSEIRLALHLLRFHETLLAYAQDLYPHQLTEYLYQLAGEFNLFFRDCRVEGSNEEESRLLLCELTANVFSRGLDLLGLKRVERM